MEETGKTRRIAAWAGAALLIVVGFVGAYLQMRGTSGRGARSLEYMAGQYVAYGGMFFGVLWVFIRKPRLAAVIAAALFCVGINLKAYGTSSSHSVEASVRKAAPTISALLQGEALTDDQIKARQIGVFEPVVLAQAAQLRELSALSNAYEKQVDALGLDAVMGPENLATDTGRATIRDRLRQSREFRDTFHAKAMDLLARHADKVKATVVQVGMDPKDFMKSYEKSVQLTVDYLEEVKDVEAATFAQLEVLMSVLERGRKYVSLAQNAEGRTVVAISDDATLKDFQAAGKKLGEFEAQMMHAQERLNASTRQSQDRLTDLANSKP